MDGLSQNNRIVTGSIWKQLLLFFFPILIGTFFQQLYSTIDAVIIGRFAGKAALAAVGGASAQIISLVVGFFGGLTSGGGVLISQYYGAKDSKRLGDALHTAYGFGILGGILLGILGVWLAPGLLQLMNTPAELMDMTTLYVRVYFAGILFVLIYNMGSAILRALGDSKRPLYFLIVSSVVNIVLDLILVINFHMGVLGVALATLTSQGISAILVTATLMYKTPGVRLCLKEIRIHGYVLKHILSIGVPSGIQSSMYGVSNMIIQSALNLLGVTIVAAWTAYGKIDCLFWMISNSFAIALTTFVGQNYGAGRMDRVRKATRLTLVMDYVTSILLSILMLAGGHFMLGFFTTDPEVVEIGMKLVYIIAPGYWIFVAIDVLASSLRAQGHTLVTTLISLIGICGFRVVWIFLICDGSMQQIAYSYPISWGLSAVANIIYYLYKQKKIMKLRA